MTNSSLVGGGSGSGTGSNNESIVYGVDYTGKVWFLNSNPKDSFQWTPLPNPTHISAKRVASQSHLLWCISSDHQVYVYVPQGDIAIRIREEIYENQRWNPVEGFCSHMLPTDRSPFSNEEGTEPREKDCKLPSSSWEWEGEWQIDDVYENQVVPEGWTYAVDFPANYHPEKSWKSCVRRRRLFRSRKYVGSSRWNRVEPLHEDHTTEPFVDIGVGSVSGPSNVETCCLWAVSILGQVYFRTEVSMLNPEGSKWEPVPIKKGLEACQITVTDNGRPYVVTWTGSFMYRVGVTPRNMTGTDWMEVSGPQGGLLQLSAGFNSLWALTRDNKCWSLKGDLQEIMNQDPPTFEWMEIPGKMKSISVGKSDGVIFALPYDDNESGSIYVRFGISEDQKHGQGWKEAFGDVSWDSVSMQSGNSELPDAVDGSEESLLSLRPDLPTSSGFESSDRNSYPVGLCYIDGACASVFKPTSENDIEVGPWREDILSNLQQLKVGGKGFKYPDAIEQSASSWSKSVAAKMCINQKSAWAKGQLEICNNDTLVFHKNLDGSWMCAVTDVLSVFGDVSGPLTVVIRLRNGIHAGKADFVKFQFTTEKDTEDWREAITEISVKPRDKYSVANIWLSTQGGEIHEGGLLKVADSVTEVEVLTSSPEGDLKLHHPLIRGFLPGSELHIDIALPVKAERFSLNLKGGANIAFHFNPRMADGAVVRNSYEEGEWGVEEKDGVFPFRRGHNYTITIQCTHNHMLTTVIEKKHKFVFSYNHRMPPKIISSFTVCGDANVTSIRYDPKIPDEDSYQLEFVSSSVPGHFWKVESAQNGSVWALGYDLNVWCYLGPTAKLQKLENANQTVVKDEQTFCVYENQRWNPVSGFGSHGLPTDRHGWTDETGRIRLERDEIRLPSGKWNWVSEWEVDYDLKPGVDEKGWQYAIDFPASYHANKRLNDFVRRRRWKRVCRYTTSGPWEHIPNMKLIDLAIRMNEDCEWEVLGIRENGDVVIRCGITPECPGGDHWESVPSKKPFVSISSWYGQRIWAVGKDGFAYIKYANNWQLLDKPRETPIKSVKVGPSGVWAVGKNLVLYRRTEIQPVFPEGREWAKVCDGVSQVCLAPDGSVWGLLKSGEMYKSTFAKRMGISKSSPGGIGWELIATGPWNHSSVAGCFSRNR